LGVDDDSKRNTKFAWQPKFYLSHHTLVSILSGPILEVASLKFAELTDISEFGYVNLRINVPVIVLPGKGFGVKAGKPLLLKFAKASGPLRNEAIQY
jgi:hypothetical protein